MTKEVNYLLEAMPAIEQKSSEWLNWVGQVFIFWSDNFGIDEGLLKVESQQISHFRDLLYAIELLLDCKEAAVRLPKQGWVELEARLLTV